MTESTSRTPTAPARRRRRSGKTSSTSSSRRRRCFGDGENTSVWPPMLFVAIVDRRHLLRDVQHARADLRRRVHARHGEGRWRKNPQLTAEMMEKMRGVSEAVTRKYGLGVIMLVTMFVIGTVSWLVGKLVRLEADLPRRARRRRLGVHAARPRRVLGGVQGLLMDPAKLTGADGDLAQPGALHGRRTRPNPILYQFLGRFDLITIWVTVLLGDRALRDRQGDQGPRDDLRRSHVAHRSTARAAPGLHVHVIASAGG